MYQYCFEKYNVWQDAKDLTVELYQLTKRFPASERYGISNQLQRAAISVATNIAEGSGRYTAKDQANFTTIAYSSLMEVLCLTMISYELSYIIESDYYNTRERIDRVANRLNALSKRQKARSAQ